MPETLASRTVFSLLEVTRSIQKTLTDRYGTSFWVKAEMNKLNYYPHSGHCYPDLVEKKEGKVIAQLRATLWRDDYSRINHSFLRVVRTPLRDGINMLFCASINFDPVYGLSLRIVDIDPVFSLGELEREKLETIERLKAEGIFDRNRSLHFPLLPQRIAIISVETSKGYADFQKVIENNPWGYRFFHLLFPSVLQGERAVTSIRHQLQRIRKVISHFDAVAIIRGGGGEVGLSCFNDLGLSRDIAFFPIPVITGIGHATNETVVEMVAYKNAITPTDLANFLLDRFRDFATPLAQAEHKISEMTKRILRDEKMNFSNTIRYFRSVTDNIMLKSRHIVQATSQRVVQHARLLIQGEKESQRGLRHNIRRNTLAFCSREHYNIRQFAPGLRKDAASTMRSERSAMAALENGINHMKPENVMKRGYSIARVDGKAIRSYEEVHPNDVMETVLADGRILSAVRSAEKQDES